MCCWIVFDHEVMVFRLIRLPMGWFPGWGCRRPSANKFPVQRCLMATINIMRQSDLRLRRRRLRLRRRREAPNLDSSSWSLFARLPPSVVATLQTDALCRAQRLQEGEDDTDADSGWSIASSSAGQQGDTPSRARVDFLPLSVKFSSHVTIYVSYNGGGIADAKGLFYIIVSIFFFTLRQWLNQYL